MARYSIDGDILDGIADAINEKYEGSSQISPVDMALSIRELPVVPPGGLVATIGDVGKIVKWDDTSTTVWLDELPALNSPATASDILENMEALDENGDLIVGSFTPLCLRNWASSSPATFPIAEVGDVFVDEIAPAYGYINMVVNLGDEPMTVVFPVAAFVYEHTLYIQGGRYDSTLMGQGSSMEASGSGLTGLTFSALYMIAGGTLTDFTSMAGQIVGSIALSLYI